MHKLYVTMYCNLLSGSKVFTQHLKDMKVPVKYHKFKDLISNKVTFISKHKEDGPPILTWNQILM